MWKSVEGKTPIQTTWQILFDEKGIKKLSYTSNFFAFYMAIKVEV